MTEKAAPKCAECDTGTMVLRWSPKFGGRHFYGCVNYPTCRGTHGAHQHPPFQPLGTPANPETKALRIQVHAVLDPLWRGLGKKQRGRVYCWLTAQMGFEYHTGNCNADQCRQVLSLLEGKVPADFAGSDEQERTGECHGNADSDPEARRGDRREREHQDHGGGREGESSADRDRRSEGSDSQSGGNRDRQAGQELE